MKKRLRIGMIGGGIGGQVGKWHRHAMSLDNKYELVAGCFSSNVENGINSANELELNKVQKNKANKKAFFIFKFYFKSRSLSSYLFYLYFFL